VFVPLAVLRLRMFAEAIIAGTSRRVGNFGEFVLSYIGIYSGE
jgi:hypothetical protein